MEQAIVVDEKGSWYVNVGEFAFTDPTTGVRFEPRTPMKVVASEWVKGQPVLKPCKLEDESEEEAEPEVKEAPKAKK